MPRGAPSRILSRASAKSDIVTCSCPRRAASSAASLARLARSAPTMPGVVAASRSRSTSSASGTERVWTSRMLAPAVLVRAADDHAPVEAAGAQQRRVEDLGPVGGGEHDHRVVGLEAVHLGEDLVERLLALVVAAASRRRPPSARAADRVELVDEDDRGRGLLGLLEEVAHPRGADADDRLDELRGRHREERDAGLARDRAGEQRLAGAGRADEQHAARDAPAELAVLLRVLQEVDDLDQLALGLLDAGHVLEGHARWEDSTRRRALEREAPSGPMPPAPPPRRAKYTNRPDQQEHRAEASRSGSRIPLPCVLHGLGR